MHQDQISPMLAHLKKFAAFFQVDLEDISTEVDISLAYGQGSEDLLSEVIEADLPKGLSDYMMVNLEQLDALRLPGSTPSYLCISSKQQRQDFLAKAQQHTQLFGQALWIHFAITTGFWLINQNQSDEFQPAELNYPQFLGVDYDKGCYTGQEIVARLHFKGKLKQRLACGKSMQALSSDSLDKSLLDGQGNKLGRCIGIQSSEGFPSQVLALVQSDLATHQATLQAQESIAQLTDIDIFNSQQPSS